MQWLVEASQATTQQWKDNAKARVDSSAVSAELDKARKELQDLQSAASEHEAVLLRNFAALLNSKKQKIRELSRGQNDRPRAEPKKRVATQDTDDNQETDGSETSHGSKNDARSEAESVEEDEEL